MTDLLLPKGDRVCKLFIKKNTEQKIITVEGATMVPVNFKFAKEFEKVYYKGMDNRSMRSTYVNETSSRSHLLFSIYIERID